jgi:protoheme IX farnesyltransferase
VTRRQILVYTVALVAFTVLPYLTGLFGVVYLVAAVVLGAGFLILALRLWLTPSRRAAVIVHLASLAYLALLFSAMAVDSALAH